MKTLEVYVTALDPDEFPGYDIEASEDVFIHLLEGHLETMCSDDYDEIAVSIKAHDLGDAFREYDDGVPLAFSGHTSDLVAQIVEDVHNEFNFLVEVDTYEYPEDTAQENA